MNSSILQDVKTTVNLNPENTDFDAEIMLYLNTVFSALNLKGIGPEQGFIINSGEEKWSDYIDSENLLGFLKSYVGLNIRIKFDPPANTTLLQHMKDEVKLLEAYIMLYDRDKEFNPHEV